MRPLAGARVLPVARHPAYCAAHRDEPFKSFAASVGSDSESEKTLTIPFGTQGGQQHTGEPVCPQRLDRTASAQRPLCLLAHCEPVGLLLAMTARFAGAEHGRSNARRYPSKLQDGGELASREPCLPGVRWRTDGMRLKWQKRSIALA